jgi:hypothetical protein
MRHDSKYLGEMWVWVEAVLNVCAGLEDSMFVVDDSGEASQSVAKHSEGERRISTMSADRQFEMAARVSIAMPWRWLGAVRAAS